MLQKSFQRPGRRPELRDVERGGSVAAFRRTARQAGDPWLWSEGGARPPSGGRRARPAAQKGRRPPRLGLTLASSPSGRGALQNAAGIRPRSPLSASLMIGLAPPLSASLMIGTRPLSASLMISHAPPLCILDAMELLRGRRASTGFQKFLPQGEPGGGCLGGVPPVRPRPPATDNPGDEEYAEQNRRTRSGASDLRARPGAHPAERHRLGTPGDDAPCTSSASGVGELFGPDVLVLLARSDSPAVGEGRGRVMVT